jgi:hypothetical protein
LLVVAAIVVVVLSSDVPPPTTTTAMSTTTSLATTQPTPSTTAVVTTSAPGPTVSTQPPTSTTGFLPVPTTSRYDIVVVGDGLGGASAAIAASRLGANVALLSPFGYFGGQAGAAGVSTMDEGSNHSVLRRSGIYGELAREIEAFYAFDDAGRCYFIEDPLCPEPAVVNQFFRDLVGGSGVDIFRVDVQQVIQEGTSVLGVVGDGSTFFSDIVIDATEFSDLYPMIEGLAYEVGSSTGCLQDTTWLAIRSWYPDEVGDRLTPPSNAAEGLAQAYGAEFDQWLESFRSLVIEIPDRGQSGPTITPWDVATETQYRALADKRDFTAFENAPPITRTGVNYANDYPLDVAALEDPATRSDAFTAAIDKTYAFLWYLRWELGLTNWGVDETQSYARAQRMLWSDQIPDELEMHFPVVPYLREGRRLVGVETLTNADIANDVRGFHRFDNSVMLGGYFSDFHGCAEPESGAGFGLFEVPMGAFIPATIDGFMPGMARAASVSRSAAAAIRTQPEEIWSGQAIGIIAGLAIRDGVEVREVAHGVVQEHLLANDLIYFLPG